MLLDKATKVASKVVLFMFVPLQTGWSPSLITSPSLEDTLCESGYGVVMSTLVLMRDYHSSLNVQTYFHRYEVLCRCLVY